MTMYQLEAKRRSNIGVFRATAEKSAMTDTDYGFAYNLLTLDQVISWFSALALIDFALRSQSDSSLFLYSELEVVFDISKSGI